MLAPGFVPSPQTHVMAPWEEANFPFPICHFGPFLLCLDAVKLHNRKKKKTKNKKEIPLGLLPSCLFACMQAVGPQSVGYWNRVRRAVCAGCSAETQWGIKAKLIRAAMDPTTPSLTCKKPR